VPAPPTPTAVPFGSQWRSAAWAAAGTPDVRTAASAVHSRFLDSLPRAGPRWPRLSVLDIDFSFSWRLGSVTTDVQPFNAPSPSQPAAHAESALTPRAPKRGLPRLPPASNRVPVFSAPPARSRDPVTNMNGVTPPATRQR